MLQLIKRILGAKGVNLVRKSPKLMRLARTLMGFRLILPLAWQSEYIKLIKMISSNENLFCNEIQLLVESVEKSFSNHSVDKVGIHRKIGEAIFARSEKLYSSHEGLPKYLVRYTYPPIISIALNSHCNAACFFCRDEKYKGDSIDFDNVAKLESAIRNARVIDLTGWGEPFLYPRLSEVLSYICSINSSAQLIQFTSNGSLLSQEWGELLSGKLSSFIISINAATPGTYANQMRYKSDHITFESTIENIKAFQTKLTAEDRKRIFLHMVANVDNYHEMTNMVRLASDLKISSVTIGHYICAQEEHRDKTLWHVKKEYSAELVRAKMLGLELGVSVSGREFFLDEKDIKGAEHCLAPFEQFFIEMPGSAAPCCFMGHERMGNVYQDGFEAVWFSDLMNRLRKKRFLPPCQVCTLYTAFDKETSHISALLLTSKSDRGRTIPNDNYENNRGA